MPRFGFVGPSYRSQSVNVDCQTCMNLYVEQIESGSGSNHFALYPTPGLNKLYDLGTSPVRGLLTAQGRTFVVAGTELWELLPPTASPNKVNRGTIVSDGKPVSMASGPNQGVIASAGILYVYDGTTNALSPVALYDSNTGLGLLGEVSQVVYIDGFFFALIKNSNIVQASNLLDATTWQGVNFAEVSVFSDNVLAIFSDHRLLWMFGPNNTQPYFDSGNSPFPFDVIDGAFIEQGIAAPFSVAKLDNSIFWLGQDSRGNGIVWRANGYTPMRVSTHAVEFALSSYATIADAVCYAYQDQGHTFYVMNFPSAQKTWVYDGATQMWHERGYWNTQPGVFTQSRAGFHTFNFGMHLVGDPTTGAIYQQSINLYSDNGNPIRRIRRAPHVVNEKTWLFHTKMQLDLETGLGPVPPFQGSSAPTTYLLADSDGKMWRLGIREGGIIEAPSWYLGTPVSVKMNDTFQTTSWELNVTTSGILQPTPIPFDPTLPRTIPFVSVMGLEIWNLVLDNLGDGISILRTIPLGIVGRGPYAMLRWSNDSGHSWSNEYVRDCGQAGEYIKRVIWNRLGRSRDRVYELTVTDPVPWRIIDAYLYLEAPAMKMA